MRRLTFALIVLASAAPAAASSTCIKIDNDLDRLACYDKEAGRTPTAETFSAPKGKWAIRKETSKLTDQPTVIMSVDSDEVINCGWNRGDRVSLVLRCMENKTVLYFNTGCHMASGSYTSYGDINYRIDSDKAQKVSGDASTDNRALGLWSGGRSIPVIKQMFGKSTLVARMTPYSESPFTATFNIAGLDESIAPLREACNW